MELVVKCKATPVGTLPARASRTTQTVMAVVSLTPEQVGEVKRDLKRYVSRQFPGVTHAQEASGGVVFVYDLRRTAPDERRERFIRLQFGVFDFLRKHHWKVEMKSGVSPRQPSRGIRR